MLILLWKVVCLGAVKLTKNIGQDKYSHSGYGIDFDSCSLFSYLGFDWGKNVVIFWSIQ